VATITLGFTIYNVPYTAHLIGVGGPGPYTFALVDEPDNELPAGLSLAADGTISGTPSEDGVSQLFRYDVQRRRQSRGPDRHRWFCPQRAANQSLPQQLSRRDVSLGRQASAEIDAFGGAGTHTWSIASGSLPPGMQLLSGSGLPAQLHKPPQRHSGRRAKRAGDLQVRPARGRFHWKLRRP